MGDKRMPVDCGFNTVINGKKDGKDIMSTESNNGHNRERSSTINSIENISISPIVGVTYNKNRALESELKAHDRKAPNGSKSDNGADKLTTSQFEEYGVEGGMSSPTWILSDILQTLGSVKDKEDAGAIIDKGNKLVFLLRHNVTLKRDVALHNLVMKIQFMLYHEVSEVRALGYRILRYVIYNYDSLRILVHYKILIFIIITMGTNSTPVEKIEALKLVREFLDIPQGAECLSIGVVKSLLAIVEEEELVLNISDDFKRVCTETVCEIALLNPDLVFHSGGFEVMIRILMEEDSDVASGCLVVLLKILDCERSRIYLRNGYDLRSLISIFSSYDAEERESSFADNKLRKMAFLITLFLKSWSGLISLSHNDFECIRDLILNLKKKNFKIRDIIMDVIYDILHFKSASWLEKSSLGDIIKRLNHYTSNEQSSFNYKPVIEGSVEYNLLNNYLGLLVFILVKNGIISLLVNLIEEDPESPLSRKATSLLVNIYEMAHRLLPSELIKDTLIIPAIIEKRVLHGSIFKMEMFSRNALDSGNQDLDSKALKSYIKSVNIESKSYVDDAEFKMMVNNSKVLTVKEYEDWDWSLLFNLIQGPLRNQRRFDEIIEKNPKFLKRLMSFYRPFKYRFSKVPISNKHHKRYINAGCQLMEMLLSHKSSRRYLMCNKILPQLSEIFAQVDPFSGVSAKEAFLSRKKLENTATFGYLKFIGVLSTTTEGLNILDQWQFITCFQNIVQESCYSEQNNYLIINLFNSIDYSIDSQLRTVFDMAFTISNLKVRTFIMNHLIDKLLKRKESEFFAIKLLVNKLYDSHDELVFKAIDKLYDHYLHSDDEVLTFIIGLRPSINILARTVKGTELLMHFLKTSKGFRYLESLEFVDKEFEKWSSSGISTYARDMEDLIYSIFFPYFAKQDPSKHIQSSLINHVLESEEGLLYFQSSSQKSLIRKIIYTIAPLSSRISEIDSDKGAELEENYEEYTQLVSMLKQNLWLIGDIASSRHGIRFLDSLSDDGFDSKIMIDILQVFYNSSNWQLRGVAFYQIGRISSTSEGMEILDELGWCSVIDNYKKPAKLSYPGNIMKENIFAVGINNPYRSVKYYSLFSNLEDDGESNNLFNEIETSVLENEHITERILNLIKHLSSVLSRIVRKAMKQLTLIQKTSPETFDSVGLLLKVVRLVDRGSYKLGVRRFIFELFLRTRALENLVKKERRKT
ncbi:Piso0_001382 [Millerozyma farinosa CBS 7064]|uniref:Piso0_001382 protein n=1 Tax=Pichia sorbitophila (strain ATCC MYA-4447 / BCRC 22081 / CBS 7064 / NBRC 10061 / NRRL Y-12695) TaxID=559304 RepID=G8YKM6_PICSO|nr:Piso0_001382 [Millerozyma farinosa CBS 7064]